MSGVVYLVGAGPGDPGLITMRGAELLERADVVAYDRLVHPALLKRAARAELIDVGKIPGESVAGQERINELIVRRARAGQTVVRLKGGDPFVFGRGGEEAEACVTAGVAFEVVPGVSSAIAGPAYAGIPLTHRASASWAALATGHEEPGKAATALDWSALAKAPTAVFLMGVRRLGEISAALLAAGRAGNTPVAVVESATLPSQRVVRSTLAEVASDAVAAGVEPPAVLVVGDVVASSDRLDWFGRRPLAGKRVFVTRTRAQAGALSGLLRDAGADALEFPAIRIADPPSFDDLDRCLARLDEFEWVVFTSSNAVDAVWERLLAARRDARAFTSARIAAVGPATNESLRSHGLVADLVPPTYTAEALALSIGAAAGRACVFVPRAAGAPDAAVRVLTEAGWRCESAVAYETIVDEASAAGGRIALEAGVDAVVFTSGSTVRSFMDLWGPPPADAIVCCIGPRTAEAAREAGVRVDAIAESQSIEGLVAALIAAVGR